MTEFDSQWAQHRQLADTAMSGTGAKTKDLFDGENDALFESIEATLSKDSDWNATGGKDAANQSAGIYATTRQIIMVVLGAAVLLCLAMTYIVITNISVPLRRMTVTMAAWPITI